MSQDLQNYVFVYFFLSHEKEKLLIVLSPVEEQGPENFVNVRNALIPLTKAFIFVI